MKYPNDKGSITAISHVLQSANGQVSPVAILAIPGMVSPHRTSYGPLTWQRAIGCKMTNPFLLLPLLAHLTSTCPDWSCESWKSWPLPTHPIPCELRLERLLQPQQKLETLAIISWCCHSVLPVDLRCALATWSALQQAQEKEHPIRLYFVLFNIMVSIAPCILSTWVT